MGTLATLVVKLTADTGDFQRDMEKSAGSIGRLTSGIKQNVQNLGKVAIGGMAVVGGAAVAGGLALGKLAMDAAELETVEAAFRGIAEGSGSSMEAMLRSLEDGSSGMVSQRDLMLTYNKAAQLVGTTFANQLPDAMQYLQKVSAATGQDMGFLLDSLTVGVGRLSPMILDNLAIQVSLAEASEAAAEMFGVEADELTKAQQQAGMMSVVLEKLKKNTEAMPDVADSAAAGIARMQAKFQNTKDQLGRAFLPVLVTVMDFVSKLADRVMPVIVEWVGKLSDAITNLAPTFEEVWTWLENVKGSLMGLVEQIWPVIEPIWEWIQQNVELKDVLIALGIAIGSVVIPAILGIVAAALPLILTAAALIAGVMLIRKAWEENWGGIRTKIEEIIPQIRAFIENAIAAIRAFWEQNGEAIVAKAQEIFGKIRDAIAVVVGWVQENWPKFRDAVLGVIEKIVAWVKENWPAIKETVITTVQGILDTVGPIVTDIYNFITEQWGKIKAWVDENWPLIQSAIENVINTIQEIIEKVLNAIYEFWVNHGDKILSFLNGLWSAIKWAISTAIDAVLGIIRTVLKVISGDWEGAWQDIKDFVTKIWTSLRDWIENTAGPFLSNVVQTAMDKLVEIVKGIGSKLYNAGKEIVEQLRDGLEAKFQEVKDWFARKLKELSDMLPWNSPPRDPTSPLRGLMHSGELFWDEWLRGAERAMPKVEATMARMAGQVAATVGPSTGSGRAVGDTIFQLTANYKERDREDLARDVRFLQMVYG